MFTPTFGNSIQEYFVGKFRSVANERRSRLAALKTRDDAERYVADVRNKILSIFELPTQKSPLNAVCTGTEQLPNYRIEKIIYQSRPDLPVTANLYIPEHIKEKCPAIVFLCGHSMEGKHSTVYQTACINLTKQGYAVLIIDPISQGERYQFLNVPNSDTVNGSCTREHNMLGKQLLLVDEYFGAWRAWDAIRGLDYLLERPEIDRSRVYITGNSGGGTMTTITNLLEERFAAAAPSCYITSWQHNIENELAADSEQIPPGISALGCEMGDLLLARAPRPLLILGQKNDFFDARGTSETYEEVKRVYSLLGAEKNVELFIGPTDHGYSRHNREAMYKFFARHSGVSGELTEPAETATLAPEQLRCLPSGQVEYLSGRRHVRDFTIELADTLAAKRKKHSPDQLRDFFCDLFQANQIATPYYRVLRPQSINSEPPRTRVISRFALEVEPEIPAVLKLIAKTAFFHLPSNRSAILYIPHLDSTTELDEFACLPQTVFGLDVRGIGETRPLGGDQHSREFFLPYSYDYHFACCHMMLGESYLAAKVRDILGAIKLLEANGYSEIHLSGRGMGSIPAALAALIHGNTASVTLYNAPESWDSMLREPITLWPQSCMLKGILKHTDLPDVFNSLKNLKMIRQWDNLFNEISL